MSTPITQLPKPEVNQFKGKRKLFLVPTFFFPPNIPDEGTNILDSYWSEIRDHIDKLERSLGSISHIYHENLYLSGEEGLSLIENLNPKGLTFIKALSNSTASLEQTEDKDLWEENWDWQTCISMGLLRSQKVMKLAYESYQETTQKRFEYSSNRIDQTLLENETGILFCREDHRIQFPNDIQVFFVAPPSLDTLKKWIDNQYAQPSSPNS